MKQKYYKDNKIIIFGDKKFLFSKDRLKRLLRIEDRHFWFIGRQLIIEQWFRKFDILSTGYLLDIGCGTGWLVKWGDDRGVPSIGLDQLFDGLREAHLHNPHLKLVQGEATRLPFQNGKAGTVFLLDVLEHLIDDIAALNEVWHVLKPGGWIIVSVPGTMTPWSIRDIEAGHWRRYNESEFREKLSKAGFQLIDFQYYVCLLFPLILFSRWLTRIWSSLQSFEEHPGPLFNSMLLLIIKIEIIIQRRFRFPIGSSLIALAQKINHFETNPDGL